MTVLVQYAKPDGRILGVWQAATSTLLEAQAGEVTRDTGYQMLETDVPMEQILTDYYVHEGLLVAKQVLTLMATPRPGVAQAPSVYEVSVTPFVPCTLLVDGLPYALTEDDHVLELTSDEPHTFLVTLGPMAQMKAEPLTVEAQ